MKQSDAKPQIMNAYRNEYLKIQNMPANVDIPLEALGFYLWLESSHPELLVFSCSGDKYQAIAGWLSR